MSARCRIESSEQLSSTSGYPPTRHLRLLQVKATVISHLLERGGRRLLGLYENQSVMCKRLIRRNQLFASLKVGVSKVRGLTANFAGTFAQ
jgi:hypothetical protein